VTAIGQTGAGPTAPSRADASKGQLRPPEYRYGLVLVLVLALVVFVILAPTAPWSRAVALGIESVALVAAIGTSRSRASVRRRGAAAAGAAAVIAAAGVVTGLVPTTVTLALSGILAFAIPPALSGGLVRLVRERGVTAQAVAGTLAIYLLIGLVFAWTIGVVSRIEPGAYFAQGTSGTDGQRVYFSFTVLTTTGFGDLSVATPAGRGLAVLEMLTGQLYLVTVIGVVVGNFRRRPGGPLNLG